MAPKNAHSFVSVSLLNRFRSVGWANPRFSGIYRNIRCFGPDSLFHLYGRIGSVHLRKFSSKLDVLILFSCRGPLRGEIECVLINLTKLYVWRKWGRRRENKGAEAMKGWIKEKDGRKTTWIHETLTIITFLPFTYFCNKQLVLINICESIYRREKLRCFFTLRWRRKKRPNDSFKPNDTIQMDATNTKSLVDQEKTLTRSLVRDKKFHEYAVIVVNLHKAYDDSDVVRGIDFAVKPGKISFDSFSRCFGAKRHFRPSLRLIEIFQFFLNNLFQVNALDCSV